MQDSDIPVKFPIPWANAAGAPYLRNIPQASQIGILNGAASLVDGFPPNCFVPIAGGGSWPWAQDFNGILKQITQWLRWHEAGAPIFYDSAFQTAIGGYPKGAIIASLAYAGVIWQSTADNNTTNPDAAGAGWAPFPAHASQTYATPGTFMFTVPEGVTRIKARYWGGGGGGTGSSSFNCPGGAGGGGGYGENLCIVVPGQVLTIVVGAGGAAGFQGGSTSITGSSPAVSGGAVGGQGGTQGNAGAPGTSGNGGTATGNIFTFAGGGGNTIQPNGAGTFWISTAGPSFGCTQQQAAGSASNTGAGGGQFPGGGSTGATGGTVAGTGGQVILEW